MKQYFNCIGIVGRPRHSNALKTHEMLYRWLIKRGYKVFIEYNISKKLKLKDSFKIKLKWSELGTTPMKDRMAYPNVGFDSFVCILLFLFIFHQNPI